MPAVSPAPAKVDAVGLSERGKVWNRLEGAALRYHAIPRKRGLLKIIAQDAERTIQTVSDWKAERAPVPEKVLRHLADHYAVPATYLMGYTDLIETDGGLGPHELPHRMGEMVNDVLDRVCVEVSALDAIQMCAIAADGLLKGQDDTSIYGAIFQHLKGSTPNVAVSRTVPLLGGVQRLGHNQGQEQR